MSQETGPWNDRVFSIECMKLVSKHPKKCFPAILQESLIHQERLWAQKTSLDAIAIPKQGQNLSYFTDLVIEKTYLSPHSKPKTGINFVGKHIISSWNIAWQTAFASPQARSLIGCKISGVFLVLFCIKPKLSESINRRSIKYKYFQRKVVKASIRKRHFRFFDYFSLFWWKFH